MLTEFEGIKVIYRDMWDLQSKLTALLETLQKKRITHHQELVSIGKQVRVIRNFLGQHYKGDGRSRETNDAA